MDARDRRLLEATARAVRVVLRRETHKYKQRPQQQIYDEEMAEKKLAAALEFTPVDLTQKEVREANNFRDPWDQLPVQKTMDAPGPDFESAQHRAAYPQNYTREMVGHRVLKFIKSAVRGATCDELEAALNLRHQSASARVHDLMDAGLIVDSGLKRETRSGRKAIVWIAKEQQT